ncbi:MAG: hypothetical protein NW220_13190 [Leptolyngbyaceae cyanobacterium bins.349]|nr:hypothetical protein [Leptolyngbyaceae cyanobacterium bins.349]
MSSHTSQPLSVSFPTDPSFPKPQTFADAIAYLQTLALQEFDREVAEQQLCYHNRHHVVGVQCRANQIFQVICPYLNSTEDCDRLQQLLDLCAITHDLIQIFVPQSDPHTARRRAAGVSEHATIERLFELIKLLNEQALTQSAQLSAQDLHIIQEAIAATICEYDATEQAIFQPLLYQQQPISWVARILALADIGALGMDGITAYNLEGSLLFLEENLDVRSLIQNQQLETLMVDNPVLHENIRQRLLRRTRFQVNLAKSRLNRCPQELAAFPSEVIPVLTHEVFRYLTPETIGAILASTPTADDTPVDVLINFFQFEQALAAGAL